MKTSRMSWMLLAAALALPVVASAQHGHPSAAPATPAAPGAPAGAALDLDELLAQAGEGDDWFAEGDEMWMGHGGPGGDAPRMARRHRMRAQGGHAMGMHMRLSRLDLTEAQRGKMRDLHEAAQRKNIQREADMKLARMDLHKLMRADAPSAQAVNSQIDKLSKLRADGMKAHYDTWLQARALLTPEQLQKLKDTSGPGASMKMHHGSDAPEGAKH